MKNAETEQIWSHSSHTVFPDVPSNTARNVLQIPANSTEKDILIGDFPEKIKNNVVPSPFRTLSQNLKTVKQTEKKLSRSRASDLTPTNLKISQLIPIKNHLRKRVST